MKKYFLIIPLCALLTVAVTSCNTQKENTEEAETEDTEFVAPNPEYLDSEAQKQLEAILMEVSKSYSGMSMPNAEALSKRYCSKDWNKVFKNNKQHIDFDFWCQCQDFDNVQFERIIITDLAENRAHASYEIVDGGNKTNMEADLVLENGKWLIDDFYYFDFNRQQHSMKSEMKK